MLFIIKIGVN